MTTVVPIAGVIKPHGILHAKIYNSPVVKVSKFPMLVRIYPTRVQVSLNRAAKPGRIAFKRDGSILRTYRLGRLSRAPRWVRDVADDVMAGAS